MPRGVVLVPICVYFICFVMYDIVLVVVCIMCISTCLLCVCVLFKRFPLFFIFAFLVPSVFCLLMSHTRDGVPKYVATPYALSDSELVDIQV